MVKKAEFARTVMSLDTEKKERVIREPGPRFAPFADADQMAEHSDGVIEEKKQAGMGRSFGPVQVARSGQKATEFRPKPPTATDQPSKPPSSTPQRRKGQQR